MSKSYQIESSSNDKIEVVIDEKMLSVQFDAETLNSDLNAFIEKGVIECVINLKSVEFVDSSGLGILISMLTKFRNRGGEVYLTNISEQVQKLLIITKLNSIFEVK